MKLLVLTSEPITAKQLRESVGGHGPPEQLEVMVVAPALHKDAFHFWLSDADDAIARAEEVRRQTVERLGQEGVAASADVGASDPAQAVEDALRTFPAERIVVFTHPPGHELYREDLDEAELQARFGLPVEHVSL